MADIRNIEHFLIRKRHFYWLVKDCSLKEISHSREESIDFLRDCSLA